LEEETRLHHLIEVESGLCQLTDKELGLCHLIEVEPGLSNCVLTLLSKEHLVGGVILHGSSHDGEHQLNKL